MNLVNPFLVSPSQSYLVSEDFEGTGTPSGWTASGMTMDDATTPLVGSKSARINNTNAYAYVDFTAQDEVWSFAVYQNNTNVPWVEQLIIAASDDTVLLSYGTLFDSQYWCLAPGKLNNSASTNPLGSKVYIWMHYKKGSGSNAEGHIYISSTTTKPGSPSVSWTDSTATQQASRFRIKGGGGSEAHQFDYVRVSITAIGDAPA